MIKYDISFIFGDWGLGIGDCPIPNPQSPIPKYYYLLLITMLKII